MNDFPELQNNSHRIKETILTLDTINYQVAELLRIKEGLEKRLCEYLEHGEDGSKTYLCERHKVTVTTGYNYSLDKDEYFRLKSDFDLSVLTSKFNPIIERVAYDLDKKAIKDCERYGSEEEIELMSQFISKKPKKLHIKISAGI